MGSLLAVAERVILIMQPAVKRSPGGRRGGVDAAGGGRGEVSGKLPGRFRENRYSHYWC